MSDEGILKGLLETTFSQGVQTDWDDLRRFLNLPEFSDRARKFKRELADTILNHKISPQEFERLTAIDQDTQEDVDKFLIEEIWKPLYKDEPVSLQY